MNNKILILDDEDPIRQFMKINLDYQGYQTIEASSGEEALRLVDEEQPAVAILDIMLPGISGLEVCEKIRDKYPMTGIIMVSAKSQDIDKILGLEKGADDYIIKPFNPQELILRVKSLMRRVNLNPVSTGNEDVKSLKDGPFTLDIYSKTFYKDDIEIDVTPTEFTILEYFIKNKGKAMTRDEIMKETWGDNYSNDTKIVDVNIRRIRAKIEENPAKPEYIETVWGTGYRWK
ncbi:response regulator transcription factor [Anaerococcus sp. NML200574]|uniref:Response regulator transcription factor n=1 Tax=Anaerococcus kampingae TaxID=3115614 RepID=A0ABW9MEP3_9FIRM|nr:MULTISPECIES: response regulator transcription factor [unclassified Anaerococcus]MCW6678010.1 response regulator transcription factor [Anaerococcus sp. NML200574]MCW6700615.1 response regulator transcription factor [Anaerococcus sp. NML200537]